jgi:TolB-like protein/class 3 adenylate cyclase/Tfp pilus assembly protein PilF
MADERVERRLAAILAADVVGYTRLMEEDETGTLAALKSRRKDILQPLLAKHAGRIIKLMGDGVLVEFASAVNAVQCAIELQSAMAAANADLPQNCWILLRVGINLGDVIVEAGDLYGDGVNIAARLQALADPGTVVVSGTVVNHVRGKVKLGFEDHGEQVLRNMTEPVRVYRVRPGGDGMPAMPALALPEKPSIAVLPFTNMGEDEAQEYFADGMVEEIITALSRFRNLFVIARNSSFAYKGRAIDVKQVGRELGVRYVLEGSVRRAGERLRINGQLIDASNGTHLWAERFDGALAEVFDLQDRIATSVVGAIAPRLEEAEIDRAKRKPTGSLDAYDLYLRGLAATYLMTRGANEEALRLFGKAIEHDPDFALPHARAAHIYGYRKANGWMIDPVGETAAAVGSARRAVYLGRDDALALSYGGFILAYVGGDLDDGAAFVDRALSLNANLAAAWGFSGWIKVCFGETDTAIEHTAIAMRLSPLDPRTFAWQHYTSLAHLCAGRYDDAAVWAERAVRSQPNFASAMRSAAASHALAGRAVEAEKAMAQLRQFYPQLRLSKLADVIPPFRRSEHRDRLVEGLRKAGLPE